MKARTVAVLIINAVVKQQMSLTAAFAKYLPENATTEISLSKQLCFGCLRYYLQLDFIAQQLLEKPIRAKDSDIYHLLLIGIYQLLYMRVAEHAVVKETVNVALALKKPWAKGLINAVLRNVIRRKTPLLISVEQQQTAKFAHPQWLIDSIKKAWPQHWQHILLANNQQAPMSLRVNLLKISRDDYLQQLHAAKILAEPAADSVAGIMLQEACPVEKLPGFAAGQVSVQDIAAQLAMPLLQLDEQQTILDACAAPGGKTAHIVESGYTFKQVMAVDKDKQRCQRIEENLQRLQLTATVICQDATQLPQDVPQQQFERILLDAPCSATGVIRRHPDIKLLRRADDIPALAKQQLQLLTSVWALLKTNGLLLYATCSILPTENQQVIATFLQQQTDAQEQPIDAHWGQAQLHGRQILPGEANMDGFYYCLLQKVAS